MRYLYLSEPSGHWPNDFIVNEEGNYSEPKDFLFTLVKYNFKIFNGEMREANYTKETQEAFNDEGNNFTNDFNLLWKMGYEV